MSSKKIEGIWILYVFFFLIFPLIFIPSIYQIDHYFASNQRAKEIMKEWKYDSFSTQPNMSLVHTANENDAFKMAEKIAREQIRNNFWHQTIKNNERVFVEKISTVLLATASDGGKIYSNGEMFMYEYSYGSLHPARILYNPKTKNFDLYAFHR
jgi:hypothetical protein